MIGTRAFKMGTTSWTPCSQCLAMLDITYKLFLFTNRAPFSSLPSGIELNCPLYVRFPHDSTIISKSDCIRPNPLIDDPNGNTCALWKTPDNASSIWSAVKNRNRLDKSLSLFTLYNFMIWLLVVFSVRIARKIASWSAIFNSRLMLCGLFGVDSPVGMNDKNRPEKTKEKNK